MTISNYENGFGVTEVDELSLEFNGCETAYIAKDFNWIVYKSHEGTITFSGSILYDVKRILKPKQEYWNIYNQNWVNEKELHE